MAKRNRLTNNSDETDIAALISGDTIFSIPYFQRPYKWKPQTLKQLNSDILNLVDESTDFHFLGAVIVHGQRSNPSDPDVFDVIDGQQRITTIFLYICAIVRTFCLLDEHEEAAGLFNKYLVIGRRTRLLSNYKIHPCKDDRAQLNIVFSDILSDQKLVEELEGFNVLKLPDTGKSRGTLLNNYRNAKRFLKDENQQGGLERIRAICSSLLNNVCVVQIDVWDPTNGPKIFDSLNSRQEPMTIGDLVRNEIFSRVANAEEDTIERVDSEHWQPFYKKFDQNGRNLFDSYFFPYGLIQNPNLKKSEVYNALKISWDGIEEPELIIRELSTYQNSFIDLMCGTNLSNHSNAIHKAFLRLYATRLPSSTYPFLMQVSNFAAGSGIDERLVISVLSVVESFLVRRAICGHEPTGLHAIFKRLWSDCNSEITIEKVTEEISKHRTVVWPSEIDTRKAIESRALYGVAITKYLIIEFDRHLKGDAPDEIPWIEHVLPRKPESKWFEHFSEVEHESMKDCLANLLPLSSKMNRSLSNRSYIHKRKSYREDSMFKSTRKFALEFETWTPQKLKQRSSLLANWVIKRWPHERAK